MQQCTDQEYFVVGVRTVPNDLVHIFCLRLHVRVTRQSRIGSVQQRISVALLLLGPSAEHHRDKTVSYF